MWQQIVRFVRDEQAQDIIEYALLAAFISIVAWGTYLLIGGDLETIYGEVNDATTAAVAAAGS